MTTDNERQFYAQAALADGAEGKMEVVTYSLEEWEDDDIVDPLCFHKQLGFTFPTLGPSVEDMTRQVYVFQSCPALIAQSTAFLSEHEFNEYLMWIRLHCDLHIIYAGTPLDRVESVIEDYIEDQPNAADVMEIVHRVRLALLDR